MASITTHARSTVVWIAAVFFGSTAGGQQLLPNAGFTQGDSAPEGWLLQGPGGWRERSVLEVVGTGQDSSAWYCPAVLQSAGLYRFACIARRVGGSGGCMVSGPEAVNRDHQPTEAWLPFGHVFRASAHDGPTRLRIGQWHVGGRVQVKSAELWPVLPIHTKVDEWVLGEDESICDGFYRFQTYFLHEGSNYHRTLHGATAGFNSNRWTFGRCEEVVYRLGLPGQPFQDAEMRFNVCHHQAGRILLEVSTDGMEWHVLAEQAELGPTKAALPRSLLPAADVYLRLRTPDEPGALQVDYLEFVARIDDAPADVHGRTRFADIVEPSDQLRVDCITCEAAGGSGPSMLRISLRAAGGNVLSATLQAAIVHADGSKVLLPPTPSPLPPDRPTEISLPLPTMPAGRNRVCLTFTPDSGQSLALAIAVEVPEYYRSDYGHLLDDTQTAAAVWWCRADHKIPRHRVLPIERAAAAELSAARNDHEAVQLVVRAGDRPLAGLTATASSLVGPNGTLIDARHIELSRVYYHYVETPTDQTGVRDWWPDALPPMDVPLDVPAGWNQPIWVLIYVPEAAVAGEYSGAVTLKADGFAAEIPIRLRVWDFALPRKSNLETAFGLSLGTITQYHRLNTEADRRAVWEKYLALMSRSRLSPYDPTPMDPILASLKPDADPPRAELNFAAFDREFARVVEKFHFTNFQLRVQGMGGGTFHERYEPAIGPYAAGTPQYEATFASYVRQLESHLREKGWLDMAYIYWFDEPDPKDYQFVANGMNRLKRYAPGLARMLTEEPSDNVLAGTVDIWCPVSHNFDPDEAATCFARGERFWWYVCCSPKAPYCTLFIDHPATELRVWHWQTWQRGIAGTLVWASNYWTSDAAYPDGHQNPYEDPMGWVSGYSTPKGAKRPWGNGDGRFIYPPLAAATPEIAGEGPVLDPPVSSIRLEMLREGVEDYEMLYLLRTLISERGAGLQADQRARYESLLAAPPEITADMTTFTTDPEPIHARRAEIAKAIERLSRGEHR